ncbi:hypothetical protein [Atopomonas hussainii]|nr:hypothetical protein [Atopomonas hussainii]
MQFDGFLQQSHALMVNMLAALTNVVQGAALHTKELTELCAWIPLAQCFD